MKNKGNASQTISTMCIAPGCGSTIAPFGYHGRHYCREHRDQGEALITATSDGVAGPTPRSFHGATSAAQTPPASAPTTPRAGMAPSASTKTGELF